MKAAPWMICRWHWKVFGQDGKAAISNQIRIGEIVNKGTMDTLQINTFKQYDKIKGKIPEPKVKESGDA